MKQKTALCYNEVFKRKVVKEIEEGVLTISQARTIYNIGGSSTLQCRIEEYRINDRIGRTVHYSYRSMKYPYLTQGYMLI